MSSNCKWISCLSSPGPAKEEYLTLLIMVFISLTLDTAAMIRPKVHHCFSIQEDHVCFLGGFKPSWMIFLSNLLVPAWVTWHAPMPSHPWAPFTGVGQSFAGGMGYIFSCLFFFFFCIWDVAALGEAQNLFTPQILQWPSECNPQQVGNMADSSREISGKSINSWQAA